MALCPAWGRWPGRNGACERPPGHQERDPPGPDTCRRRREGKTASAGEHPGGRGLQDRPAEPRRGHSAPPPPPRLTEAPARAGGRVLFTAGRGRGRGRERATHTPTPSHPASPAPEDVTTRRFSPVLTETTSAPRAGQTRPGQSGTSTTAVVTTAPGGPTVTRAAGKRTPAFFLPRPTLLTGPQAAGSTRLCRFR